MNTPFRVGATSFVYADGWLANVERLAGRVRDVEILFFEVNDPGCLPTAAELKGLALWKVRGDLTYTLHTPLDASLASEDETRRRGGVEKVCRAINAARPLNPHSYVVHVYLGDREHDRPPSDLKAWRLRATRSLEEIIASGIGPETLCVESIDYDFALVEPVIEALGLSVALDVGHLHRDGRLQEDVIARNLHRTRVIQWHGTDPTGRDHRSLSFFPTDRARLLVDMLLSAGFAGVLTLEVFREDDFEESLAILGSLLSGGRA